MTTLRSVRFLVVAVICAAIAFVVVRTESGFNRPPLSARPQVWLSNPVDWRFETAADRAEIFRSPSPRQMKLSITGFAESTTRAKEGGATPVKYPIQTQILFSTLQELDLRGAVFTVTGIDNEGAPSSLDLRASRVNLDGDRIWLDDASAVGTLSNRVTEGVTLSQVVFSARISVDTCELRESRQVCPLADFAGADLSRGDFELAVLRGADFTGATLKGSKLGGADLSGAILENVDLANSWLVGVDIDEAFMENVDFSNASWTR